MPRAYKPGDAVARSGVYRVVHGARHRLVHEATIEAGIRFPRCRVCEDQVRFTLLRDVRGRIIILFRPTETLEEYEEISGAAAAAK